ncbi:MAG TPA: hypothetical protein VL285_07950 [Bryobacteraceae bacterium]|nr:hypothetical protein [Bryobacteraceae bacterium]
MKKSVVLGILFCIVVLGAVVYTTMSAGATKYRVEVCMEFQGRSACRTASAATEQQALRTAHDNACALISSGVTDSMQCGNYTQPVSVKWLSGK